MNYPRVHFTPRNSVPYEADSRFPPPPPPLILSTSTLSSDSSDSCGPRTPPSRYASLPGPMPISSFDDDDDDEEEHHAYPRPGKTPQNAVPKSPTPSAHTLLTCNGSTPLLNYKLSQPPSSLSTHCLGLTYDTLREPAVFPPRAHILITTPHLPWAIPVPASDGAAAVSISNVLNALYMALGRRVTLEEFQALGDASALMRAVAKAYERRCRARGARTPHEYEQEKQQGVRRVDFLMVYNKFGGLRPVTRAGDVWELCVL
ncbi:unnamed protein product [Mycena citricolor]|uniref:DUF6699 domain-containing protein n=1 Tax=Mycena citricolor TaxID=2018698 RepID=A0AAD2HVY4_9AGAR|nr:unnamed protein product [Mycena citricolor]CAK5282109.1 unnamed protein product [Mycena citricolor]